MIYLVEGLLDIFSSDRVAIAVDDCIWRDNAVRLGFAVDNLRELFEKEWNEEIVP